MVIMTDYWDCFIYNMSGVYFVNWSNAWLRLFSLGSVCGTFMFLSSIKTTQKRCVAVFVNHCRLIEKCTGR